MWHRALFTILTIVFISLDAHAVVGNISFGYGSGGTPLSEATGGQDYDTRAGDGFFFIGGVLLPISPTIPHRYELQLGIGYIFQDEGDDKNSVSWSRIPTEAIYYYRNTRDHYRFGWGITYQIANKISANGTKSDAETSVDNSTGWVFSAEKLITLGPQNEQLIGLGIKYVNIDYTSSSFSKDVHGDCLYFTYSAVIGDTPNK